MQLGKSGERYPAGPVQLLRVHIQGEEDLEYVFYRTVVDLQARCTLLAADGEWGETVRGLQRVWRQVRSTPLPLSLNPLVPAGLPAKLAGLAGETTDEQLGRLANRARQALETLLAQPVSSLVQALIDRVAVLPAGTRAGLLLDDGQVVPPARKVLAALFGPDRIQVGNWAGISRGPVLDVLFFFGTAEYRPTGLLKSGISRAYTQIMYSWLRAEAVPGPWFLPYEGYDACMWNSYRFASETQGESPTGLYADDPWSAAGPPEEFDSTPAALPAEPGTAWWPGLAATEREPARPVRLAGGRIIYLGAALREGAYILGQEGNVREVPVMELIIGDWLIVPGASDKNYRQLLINKKLGKYMTRCRQQQQAWKNALARRINERGVGKVIEQLQELGCGRANPANLANWAYGSVVCPQRQSDFEAIMRYLGHDRQYTRQAYSLLKMILSASHQVAETLERELHRELAGLDPAALPGGKDWSFELTFGEGRIRFCLVQVMGTGPVTDVERGNFGIILPDDTAT